MTDIPETKGTPSPQLKKALDDASQINQVARDVFRNPGKSSQEIINVVGGWTDDEGIFHNEAELRAMTGNEEDLLGSNSPWTLIVVEILNRCVKRFGPYTDKRMIRRIINECSSATRLDLLIKIRILSHWENDGGLFRLETECGRCGVAGVYDVRLDGLDVYHSPSNANDYDVELTDGSVIRWRRMDAFGERVIETVTRSKNHRSDIFTYAILVRLLSFPGIELPPSKDNGEPPKGLLVESDIMHPSGRQVQLSRRGKALLHAVKGLSVADRERLRGSFIDNEPGVDTDIETVCENCGHESIHRLDVSQPSFFFPSSTRTSSRRKSRI